MWNWNGMMAWGGFGLFHILWWAFVVALIVLLVRWIAFGRGRDDDRALSILRERYARGEIGKEEFEARKRDLEP